MVRCIVWFGGLICRTLILQCTFEGRRHYKLMDKQFMYVINIGYIFTKTKGIIDRYYVVVWEKFLDLACYLLNGCWGQKNKGTFFSSTFKNN